MWEFPARLLRGSPVEFLKRLREIPTRELVFDHAIIHAWWRRLKKGSREGILTGWDNLDMLKRVHDAIVEELTKRGVKHTSPLLEKPYAEVHSFRTEDLGPEVTLEEVLQHYRKPIVLKKGFIRLVGGLAERGATKGDIDLLIAWPSSVPDTVVHPVRFRLGRALPAELASRIQFLMDDYHGPFTSYVDLYDLVLMPSEQTVVQMGLQIRRLWRPQKGDDPSQYDDVHLMLAHSWVHWWARKPGWSSNPDWTYHDLVKFHDALVAELEKRGYIHLTPIPLRRVEIPGIKPLKGKTTSYMPEVAGKTPSHEQLTIENPMTYEQRQWVAHYAKRNDREIRGILELYGGYGYCTRWYRDVLELDLDHHIVMEIDPSKVRFLRDNFGDAVDILEGNNVELLHQIQLPRIDLVDFDTNKDPTEQISTFLKQYRATSEVFAVGDEPTLQKFIRNHPMNLRRRLLIKGAPDEPVHIGEYVDDYPNILYTYLSNLANANGWTFELWAFGADIRWHQAKWMGVFRRVQLTDLSKPYMTMRTQWWFYGNWRPSVLVTLKGRGCQWNKCVFCYYSKTRYPEVTDEQILSQIEYALTKYPSEGLVIYTNGSFTDDREIPPSLREQIFKLARKHGVKYMLVESRADLPLKPTVELAKKYSIKLQVAIGVEVRSQHIRNEVLRKNESDKDIERAFRELLRLGVEPRAYLLLKPPYVDEETAVREIENAVDWLLSLGVRVIDINCAKPDKRAPEFWELYQSGQWSPPKVESLARVVRYALEQGAIVDIYPYKDMIGDDRDRELLKQIRKAVSEQKAELIQLQRLRDPEAEKQAKTTRQENRIEPLRFFYPLKAVRGYHEGEVYSIDQILSWFREQDYPLYIQKKYDGLRVIWMKKGDKVIARTDDGYDCTDRFPTLVEQLKRLPVEAITLDSEVEGWSGEHHWGREETSGYVHEKGPADDRHFVANVFDILYVEGLPKHHELDVEGDLHELPYETRYRILEYVASLGKWESTAEVPKRLPGFNLVPNFVLDKPDAKKLQKILDEVKNLPGSEGAMIKSSKGTYPLTGLTRTWLKFKKAADVHAVVVERLPTKTPGVYRYRVGLLIPPGWDVPKDKRTSLKLKNGQEVEVAVIGKTFNTKEKLEPGDIVTVLFHTAFLYERNGKRWMTAYEPKLYEVRPSQVLPDTLDDFLRVARAAGILQVKHARPRVVAVTVCSPEHASKPLPARRFYRGEKVQRFIEFCEKHGIPCRILSPKYGLVSPNKTVEPYDLKPTENDIIRVLRDSGFDYVIFYDPQKTKQRIPLHAALISLRKPRVYIVYHLDAIPLVYERLTSFRGSLPPVLVLTYCSGKKATHEGTPAEIWAGVERIQRLAESGLPWGVFHAPEKGIILANERVRVRDTETSTWFDGFMLRKRLKELGVKGIVAYVEHLSGMVTGFRFLPVPVEFTTNLGVAKLLVENHHLWARDRQWDLIYEGPADNAPDYVPAVAVMWREKFRGLGPITVLSAPAAVVYANKPVRGLAQYIFDNLERIPYHSTKYNELTKVLIPAWLAKQLGARELKIVGYTWYGPAIIEPDLKVVAYSNEKITVGLYKYLTQGIGEDVLKLVAQEEGANNVDVEVQWLREHMPRLRNIELRQVDPLTYEFEDITSDDVVMVDMPKITSRPLHYLQDIDEYVEQNRMMLRRLLSRRPRAVIHLFSIVAKGKVARPTVQDVKPIYDQSGYEVCLRMVTAGGGMLYLFVRKDVPAELALQWMDDKPHTYVMQHHYRGRSMHTDLRVRVGNKLIGWTLNDQKAGAIKEDVDTLQEAKRLEREHWNDISKLTNKTFDYWSNRIMVEPKAPEPLEWLDVEGVVPPGEVGATKEHEGVFSIIDRGELYFGAVKPYFVEMFLHGKRFTGRWLIRKLPNPWGEHPAFVWFIWKPKDQMPYVLSRRAVEKKWLPPKGVSALPPEIREQIPKQYRYWEIDDRKKALQIRDELVEKIRKGEVKIAIPKKWLGASMQYVLQYQWWRGPIVIRRGPSRQQWLLWLGDDCYVLDSDPLSGPVTATRIDVSSKWRDKGEKEAEEVPAKTDLNPTKATPSWIRMIDRGTVEVIDKQPLFMKLRFDGDYMRGLWIMEREDPRTELWTLRQTESVHPSQK